MLIWAGINLIQEIIAQNVLIITIVVNIVFVNDAQIKVPDINLLYVKVKSVLASFICKYERSYRVFVVIVFGVKHALILLVM